MKTITTSTMAAVLRLGLAHPPMAALAAATLVLAPAAGAQMQAGNSMSGSDQSMSNGSMASGKKMSSGKKHSTHMKKSSGSMGGSAMSNSTAPMQ